MNGAASLARLVQGVSPRGVASLVVMLAIALPWLNPRAGGPSASVHPWLFSAACAALLIAVAGAGRVARGVVVALALFGAAGLVRTGITLDTLALAGGCAVAALVACAAASSRATAAFAWGWAIAGLLSTAAALAQYFGLADQLAPWVSQAAAGEAFSNLRQRNQFATLTVIATAAVLWLQRQRGHWPAMLAAVLLAAGNAATTSRTGFLELLALTAFTVVTTRTWRAPTVHTMFAACIAYALAGTLLPPLLSALTGVEAPGLWRRVADVASCSSRRVLWSNVMELIAQRPWSGWGWGELDYAHFAHLYDGARFCDILDNAHDLPLHLAVELGLPFATLACALVAWLVWRGAPWREADATRRLAWAILLAIGLHSLLEYPLWYGPFQMAAGAALGWLWPRRNAQPREAWGAWALAGVLVVAVAYATWDYRRVSQIYLAPEARDAAMRDDPLAHARRSTIFASQAAFAEFTLSSLSRANAEWTLATGERLLHYSPEPRIVERVIDAAVLLGRQDDALLHVARFRAAFPKEYEEWARRNGVAASERTQFAQAQTMTRSRASTVSSASERQ